MGNLVLLTPAYTAFQARIAIVLQSVATFITRGCRQKSLLQIITARSWQMAKYDAVLLA